MTFRGRKVPLRILVPAVVAIVIGAALPLMSRAPAREITLVARGMAFYEDGEFGRPNPVIRVKAGERVRIRLRNEERGITHDFALPDLDAATGLLNWNQQGEVTFDAPEAPGIYEYVCNPHRLMMHGTLLVEPPVNRES